MKNNLAATYCLANDLDLASIATFIPVGNAATPFTGSFFGNDHAIRNLKINAGSADFVGLFGVFRGTTIRDVNFVNVNVTGTIASGNVGALAGSLFAPRDGLVITNVKVSGKVNCGPDIDTCGGVVGALSGYTLVNMSSAADVAGSVRAGGVAGATSAGVENSFATGQVSCNSAVCQAGGLVGVALAGAIENSFATGAVTGGDLSVVGGLVGTSVASISHSFAAGNVSSGNSSIVGGLIGLALDSGSVTDQSFSTGLVHGGSGTDVGGLIGSILNGPTVTHSYWDTATSGTVASPLGTGMTTAQLRAGLPAGFDPAFWAINKTLSYPFSNDGGSDLTPQLAMLVLKARTYVFLPLSQLDISQYRFKPAHTDEASLAAVETMIARAIGTTGNVAQLKNVKIDRFFWHDPRQTTTFVGPVTMHATLGVVRPVSAAANLAPVTNQLSAQRPVILRGAYTTSKGASVTHWMLATLFTKTASGSASTIVANDPWTGWQVEIDPASKKIVSPVNFPLANFKVNGFQAVTIH
ncbi:MAG: GLUG motif-containing protein [Pseudolabrys sp.]